MNDTYDCVKKMMLKRIPIQKAEMKMWLPPGDIKKQLNGLNYSKIKKWKFSQSMEIGNL